ncbi:MAG: hypothetical protein J2P55_00380 [Rhizobiales bacterium]|nr:hypothetical protein [Hyphomicrobiales bacterium]
MELYSLHLWSKSIGGRCRFIEPSGPLPQAAAMDDEDRVLLARLRDEIILAHIAIEGSRSSIIESWSLVSRCERELRNRH